jgi:signal transduction histidine kinase
MHRRQSETTSLALPRTAHRHLDVDGLRVCHRETEAPAGAPTLLLPHGFPSGSHQFRRLMAALDGRFRPIGPDYHAVLSDRGLAAVETLARRAPLPVEILGLPAERLPEYFELATYFVVSEALTNIAKYASASRASVTVTRSDGRLDVAISADGVGGAEPDLGTGLRGLSDRLAAIEGQLDIDSKPGRGTSVRARIPCPEADRRAPVVSTPSAAAASEI